jgi:hypothetical protein
MIPIGLARCGLDFAGFAGRVFGDFPLKPVAALKAWGRWK